MSNYRKCSTCGEFGWFGSSTALGNHLCAPAWQYRIERKAETPDDWETVRAYTAKEAAQKFAEHYDCSGGEYAIVGGRFRDPIIEVQKPGNASSLERWAIRGEPVPTYRANKIEGQPA